MHYFNIEIQVPIGEGDPVAAIYDRGENLNDAIIANHNALASMRTAVAAGTIASCAGLVINEQGGIEVPRETF